MLFGYLIVRRLLVLVRAFGRLPDAASQAFARVLNSVNCPFHLINYWGSGWGAKVIKVDRMGDRYKTIVALQRRLDAEQGSELARRMHFPTRWVPFFTDVMTLKDVYHYVTQHFQFNYAN